MGFEERVEILYLVGSKLITCFCYVLIIWLYGLSSVLIDLLGNGPSLVLNLKKKK